MSDFKTTEEIFKYLVDGGKVRHITWNNDCYVHFKNGFPFKNAEQVYSHYHFSNPEDWVKYIEPKPTEEIRVQAWWNKRYNCLVFNSHNLASEEIKKVTSIKFENGQAVIEVEK